MAQVQRVRPRKAVEIEAAAESLIRRFQPKVLEELLRFDVERFFEDELEADTGIRAGGRELPKGMDGVTDAANMHSYIADHLYSYKDRVEKHRRLRSTIAHELGHCYLHVQDSRNNTNYLNRFENSGSDNVEMFDESDLAVYENPEWQAWRFASALLMPEKCFRRAFEVNWKKRMILNTFEVNPSFMAVRMRQLGIKRIF